MPQINVAMMASRTQPLQARASSISDQVSSVKNSFSSWDNCMNASYCKWPVIAVIIIGGLIVLSVVWCIVRCACCGLSCCCGCFSCLKCCGECCGMCSGGSGGRNKRHKQIDEPYQPQPFQPSQSFQPAPYAGYQAPPAPIRYEKPQYAQFEVGKSGLGDRPKVHEDALPAMPSWEGATSKRISLPTENQKDEGMEMGNLTPDGQHIPLMSGAVGGGTLTPGAHTPGATSPIDEAGGSFFNGRGAPVQNGYMQGRPGGNMPNGPNGMSRTGSPAMMNGGLGPNGMNRTGSPAMMNGRGGPGMNMQGGGPGYGAPNRGDMSRGQFNQSPGPGGFNQRPGFPPAAGYRGPPQRQYSNQNNPPYGQNGPPRQFSNDSYGQNGPQQPQRQFSNGPGASYPPNGSQRQLVGNAGFPQPGRQRQYSDDSYRPSQDTSRPPVSPSSPLQNSGGFDFGLGSTPSSYEPPSQERFGQSNYAPSTAAPSYATAPPPQQQRQMSPPSHEYHFHDTERSLSPPQEAHELPGTAVSRPDGAPAYPGYKPYSPAPRETARTPPPPAALTPGRPNY